MANEKNLKPFKEALTELLILKPLKEPGFVICDGHFAIIKAAKKLWKNVGIQRRLVHIARDSQKN